MRTHNNRFEWDAPTAGFAARFRAPQAKRWAYALLYFHRITGVNMNRRSRFVFLLAPLFLLGCSHQLSRFTNTEELHLRETWPRIQETSEITLYVIPQVHEGAKWDSESRKTQFTKSPEADTCQRNIPAALEYLYKQGAKILVLEGLSSRVASGNFEPSSIDDLSDDIHVAGRYFSKLGGVVYGGEPRDDPLGPSSTGAMASVTGTRIILDEARANYGLRFFLDAEPTRDFYTEYVRYSASFLTESILRSMHALNVAIRASIIQREGKVVIILGKAHYPDFAYAAERINTQFNKWLIFPNHHQVVINLVKVNCS